MKPTDSQVYYAYIEAKRTGKKTAIQVARELGITRDCLYKTVTRVALGNQKQIKICTEEYRMDCLWRWKYRARFLAIPKTRQRFVVDMLKKLMRDMKKDKFSESDISRFTEKDRATVRHHTK